MLKSCPQCGSANGEHRQTCYVCYAPLGPAVRATQEAGGISDSQALARDILDNIPAPATAPTGAAGAPPDRGAAKEPVPIRPNPLTTLPLQEPEWRREVSHRLQAYRASRRRTGEAASQNALPFEGGAEPQEPFGQSAAGEAAQEGDARAGLRVAARARKTERVEILAEQPELVFLPRDDQLGSPNARLVPVAELSERRHTGLLDAGFLLLAYGGFLLLFSSLGGRIAFGKVDAAVLCISFFLFYVQYFALFTVFGGATPGMMMRGLHVVSFEGQPATSQQLLWRGFGYVVSGATILLGFAWALWDEDRLTWQDRISQTYLTNAPQVAADAIGAEGSPQPQ